MIPFKALLAILAVPSLLLCPLSGQEPQEKPAVKSVADDLLDVEMRVPKKGETVLQYFQFLEKTLWEKKVQLRLRLGPSGLAQYANLMKQPASTLFMAAPGDPFAGKNTLRHQLDRMAEPTGGRVEITGKTVTISSMMEDSDDSHDK